MNAKKNMSVVAALILVPLMLSGCVSSIPKVNGDGKAQPAPALSSEQLVKVEKDLKDTLAAADAKRDKNALNKRLAGPALAMRTAQYQLAASGGEAPPAISVTPQVSTISTGTTWPRAAFEVSKTDKDGNAYALVFRQNNARDNFKMWSWVRLFPAVTVAQIPTVEVGTQLLPEDAKSLAATPKQAVQGYVEFLNNEKAASAAKYDADPFVKSYRAKIAEDQQKFGESGTVARKAAMVNAPITSFALSDGSALVAATFTYTTVYHRTKAEAEITLGGSLAQMLEGNGKVVGKIAGTYDATVLILVPKTGSKDKFKVLGADYVLREASRDDSAQP